MPGPQHTEQGLPQARETLRPTRDHRAGQPAGGTAGVGSGCQTQVPRVQLGSPGRFHAAVHRGDLEGPHGGPA